jgi:hypothetical protein
VQSVEEALAESEAAGHASAPSETSDLAEHPEVREHLRELTRAHYESWVSESIPALGGLSPLEAVQSPSGRDKVRALVDQIERNAERLQPPLDDAIVPRLRQRLGLF